MGLTNGTHSVLEQLEDDVLEMCRDIAACDTTLPLDLYRRGNTVCALAGHRGLWSYSFDHLEHRQLFADDADVARAGVVQGDKLFRDDAPADAAHHHVAEEAVTIETLSGHL